MPKRICTTPITSAMEKNCPWKSRNFTEGNHVLMLMPKNEPHSSPNATVDTPHSVAEPRRLTHQPGFRFLASIHHPIRVRISP